jgi:5-methylcytosine-specific restriction endonuclease McrA
MDSIPQKYCPECNETKPVSEYNRDKQRPDGLQWRCKQCNRARGRTYYAANRAQVIARTSEYNKANPDVPRKAMREYRKRHRDKLLPIIRQNSARWRAANRDKDRAASLRWVKNNLTRHNVINHRRKARLANIPGSFTVEEWEQLKARYDYRCVCCHRQEPGIKLTVDHIIPTSDPRSTNFISNIQPLCKACNSAKRNHHATDYRS